jgi:hypothetical protein
VSIVYFAALAHSFVARCADAYIKSQKWADLAVLNGWSFTDKMKAGGGRLKGRRADVLAAHDE